MSGTFTPMSPPRLYSPPPDARLPRSFEDLEAVNRLKMVLLMARLRTGLRVILEHDEKPPIPGWRDYLQDEYVILEQYPYLQCS